MATHPISVVRKQTTRFKQACSSPNSLMTPKSVIGMAIRFCLRHVVLVIFLLREWFVIGTREDSLARRA